MLMCYVGAEMDTLMKANEFRELLEERGTLLHDLLEPLEKGCPESVIVACSPLALRWRLSKSAHPL